MNQVEAVVYIVDDDPSVRSAMTILFRTEGYYVRECESAEQFLDIKKIDQPACLILDLKMPGLSGTELQSELIHRNDNLPIIFLTGFGDIPTTVDAIKSGAVDFLQKPVENEKLLASVAAVIDESRRILEISGQLIGFRERVEQLTKREREVMDYVIRGLLNKQIAREMGITETTVKVHRGRVMEKTGVHSLAELVSLSERTGLAGDRKYP